MVDLRGYITSENISGFLSGLLKEKIRQVKS